MWIIRTYIGTFRKFDDFGGRANRAEFRNFGIVPFVIQLCFPVIGALSPVGYLFENVFSLVPLVPAVSLVVRRLHDTGTNGWLVLPGLVPFLNFLILYLLFFYYSDPYDNGYGLPPDRQVKESVSAQKQV
ncbi:DUF805 domain-containing protein [Oxalobacter aliiformigenes]|uniref:DUF805 domain-containing protein n=1 Tax=Oxalobacter aliiformigenes TaxID=2946593 RepID=A0ABY7JJ99_9BURK|nr:DUF805 domain-containing protein [Oxalobacter aliiformigenes]WAV92614.1 DUF805 domain-containing protein [Oxalobacter aliiformigenes]WAV95878.1 DUF805 domain-containing protein [Oxalobacter aliiformigenes]WAV96329.1 DUF805 domain-containing protein [Oxalobacter aliiformigenes]